MPLFDATHTSHTTAQTGIQRVCRSLYAALVARGSVQAVCFDPYLDAWRSLAADELSMLCDRRDPAGRSRGARWTFAQQVRGHMRRLIGWRPELAPTTGLVCPELFSARVGTRLTGLFTAVRGPRIALFHDAIALKLPELTPPATVRRMPAYLRELLQFDGIAAVSEDSAASLRDFWTWLGAPHTPPVQAIPLGIADPPSATNHCQPSGAVPRILCVGTLEGRKNHLALLEAAEALWREGVRFELELLGLARPDTATPALERLRELRDAGRPLFYAGSVPDTSLHTAYARCTFTVYPSLMEGFGLPVLESVQHGKPCLCSAHGALGEATRGGGVVALPSVDAGSLTAAMRRLLNSPGELAALTVAARARKLRRWTDYAADLSAWMDSLPRRN